MIFLSRAQKYLYTFTGLGSSDWWVRTLEGEYFPIVSNQDGLEAMLKKNGIIGASSPRGKGVLPDLLTGIRNKMLYIFVKQTYCHDVQIFYNFKLFLYLKKNISIIFWSLLTNWSVWKSFDVTHFQLRKK